MLIVTAIVVAGCNKPDEPDNGGNNGGGNNENNNNSYNGHEYVDLGLPSGTLWATCNVGAETPEGYGNYFAWGEVQPKGYYDWDNYKYCNGGNVKELTKYCTDSEHGYNGFTDNLTVLQLDDDVAAVDWGSDWSIPSWNQWKELKDNTTSTWTTQNGVNGRLFVASNGNSIFLPAAGSCHSEHNYHLGTGGEYWSNSLSARSSRALCLYIGSDCCANDELSRRDGLSVRPVHSVE